MMSPPRLRKRGETIPRTAGQGSEPRYCRFRIAASGRYGMGEPAGRKLSLHYTRGKRGFGALFCAKNASSGEIPWKFLCFMISPKKFRRNTRRRRSNPRRRCFGPKGPCCRLSTCMFLVLIQGVALTWLSEILLPTADRDQHFCQHAQPHPLLLGPNRPLSGQQLPLLPKAPKRSKRMSKGRSELRLQFMR